MREILFRAYDKGRKEYLSNGNLFIAINTSKHPNKSEIYLDEISNADKYKERFVIEQYTGLTDKNGKKIFEGDIIKIYLYEPKGLANYEVGCIKYDNTKARFVFCTKEGNYSIDNSNAFEIIGNIHDNPELLKGGEG